MDYYTLYDYMLSTKTLSYVLMGLGLLSVLCFVGLFTAGSDEEDQEK